MSPLIRLLLLSLALLAVLAGSSLPASAVSDTEIPEEVVDVPRGETPLLHAIRARDLEVVRRLLAQGAPVNQGDVEGETPLLAAVENGPLEVIELLVKSGARINTRNKSGQSVLSRAIPDVQKVSLLLRLGADPNLRSRGSYTPLMAAASWEEYHFGLGSASQLRRDAASVLTRLLLQAGAHVNATDNQGRTALSYAAEWGLPDVARLLLDAGADVNRRDRWGRSPLGLAASWGSAFSQMLLARGAKVGVAEAILLGQQERARALVAAGASLTGRGPHRETVLMLAAEQEYPDLVRDLLRRGQPVNARAPDGATALTLAVGGRRQVSVPGAFVIWEKSANPPNAARLETVRILLDRDAKVNLRVGQANTALDAAIALKSAEIVSLLRQHGAHTSEELDNAKMQKRSPL